MSSSSTAVVGIDIGGTKIAALLVGPDGDVLARASAPTPVGGEAMFSAAVDLAEQVAGETTFGALGVGAAGVIDQGTGTVVAASDSFVGWAGFPLGERLEAKFGVPAAVDNDVNAFLLGELAWGAARGEKDVLGVMLGTGVGGALVLNGALRHGPHGAAGEIGHTPGYGDLVCTCGQTGHLETRASGRSIAQRYGEAKRTGDELLTGAQVADLARAGDPQALAAFDGAARSLAKACLISAGLLDLSIVVVGGGVTRAWDLLAGPLSEVLLESPPVSGAQLSVRRAILGGDAVALGAAASARSRNQEAKTRRVS